MAQYDSHDRLYGSYKCSWDSAERYPRLAEHGSYQLPVDSAELDRLDIMNALLKCARNQLKSSVCDITSVPIHVFEPSKAKHVDTPRVLDLGCGTGIWMIEMANRFPNVHYLGVDINEMQPSTLGPNISIKVPVDIEQEWDFSHEYWDMIHLQLALGCIHDWGNLYRRVLHHLRPGTGWFESVEIDWEPRCFDGPIPSNGPLQGWWNSVAPAYDAAGRTLQYNPDTKAELEAAGFKDIEARRFIVPLSGWSLDETLQRTGMWWRIAMSSDSEERSGFGMVAMSLAMLTRMHEWHPEHARRYVREALQEGMSTKGAYNVLWVWLARAPYPGED